LTDAEFWYSGGNDGKQLISKTLRADRQDWVLESLRGLDYDFQFLDILPYAVEVFETSKELIKEFGHERKSKRAAGVFYTPSDLSDYIVEQAYSLHANKSQDFINFTWLDPACGTGVFLVSVLYQVAGARGIRPGADVLVQWEMENCPFPIGH